ncbi:OmpA family protein [Sphingobium sp. CR28]|uniref:OmpA family protein n=1 Tax=Sphingobium sp. CR28 TaxID=3400272 RepID=UPI003FEDC3A1
MNDAARIAIGAGAAMLLGWVAHGPLGYGAAFVQDLRERAAITLATGGLPDVSVDFQTQPLSRVAMLSGTAASPKRNMASEILRTVPGISSARWSESAAPDAQAAPAAETADVATCQKSIDRAVDGRALSFRSGSAWLNPQSRRIIRDVAAALKQCPGLIIEVAGHSSGAGREGVNREIAQERAKRVRDDLVAQGAPANAVVTKGYSASAPLQGHGQLDPANRRVTFTLVKGAS